MSASPTALNPACWPGDLTLPILLDDVIDTLAHSLGLPPTAGTALALQAVAAAVGPAVVLRDDPAPPLTMGLHAIIAALPGSTLPLARDAIFSPLRSLQAELFAFAATEPSLLAVPEQPLNPAEQRARLAPVILMEDSPFATLVAVPSRAFDGSVLATFSPTAWSRLWTELAATPNGSRRNLFLQSITGHVPVLNAGTGRNGMLSLLAEVRPDTESWSGLVAFLPPDLCQRSLVLKDRLGPAVPKGDHVLPPELAHAWAERIHELFQLRASDAPLEVVLSPAARNIFRLFHAELVAAAANWPEQHHELLFGWPVLARRLALLLHLASGVDGPVEADLAETGVALARYYGSHLLSLRDEARLRLEQAALQADCERLLTALKQFPSATRRQLFKRFNGNCYVRWDRALEALVSDGRAIEIAHNEFAVSENLLPVSSSTV